VLDDVGFGALSCFGGLIETPNIDRTNGMACITECATDFPGSNGHIPFERATIAEMLVERGYNTYIVGRWHLGPADKMNLASTKRHWPLGCGFERCYDFLRGETN
jgi:arylsulfatase A-like enzyme